MSIAPQAPALFAQSLVWFIDASVELAPLLQIEPASGAHSASTTLTVRTGATDDGWIARLQPIGSTSDISAVALAFLQHRAGASLSEWISLREAVLEAEVSTGGAAIGLQAAAQIDPGHGYMNTNGSVVSHGVQLDVFVDAAALEAADGTAIYALELILYEASSGRRLLALPVFATVVLPQLRLRPTQITETVQAVQSGSQSGVVSSKLTLANPGLTELHWTLSVVNSSCWLQLRGGSSCTTGGVWCRTSVLASGAQVVLSVNILAQALSTGQHNAVLALVTNAAAAPVFVPVKAVVTSVTICPGQLLLSGVAAPNHLDPTDGSMQVDSDVSIVNLGTSPLRIRRIVPLATPASEALAVLSSASSVTCEFTSSAANASALLEALMHAHGLSSWLSASTQGTFLTGLSGSLAEDTSQVQPGSSLALHVSAISSAQHPLPAGPHSHSIAIELFDVQRGAIEVRVLEVALRVQAGPASPSTSVMLQLASQVQAGKRPLAAFSDSGSLRTADTSIAIIALADALGLPRPPSNDSLAVVLLPKPGSSGASALEASRQGVCTADAAQGVQGVHNGNLVEHTGPSAVQLLSEASPRMPAVMLARLQQHLKLGGTLFTVHFFPNATAPIHLGVLVSALEHVQLQSATATARMTTTGSLCGPLSTSSSNEVLLLPNALPENGSQTRQLNQQVPALDLSGISVAGIPATCDGDGMVHDPSSPLTCICQPGFAVDAQQAALLQAGSLTSELLRCVPCPAGTARVGGTLRTLVDAGTCTPCGEGRFSLPGWHTCGVCPDHMQCSNGLVQVTSGHGLLNDAALRELAVQLAATHSGTGPGSGLQGAGDAPSTTALLSALVSAHSCPNPFACISAQSVNVSDASGVLRETVCREGHDPRTELCSGCLDGYAPHPISAGAAGTCRKCDAAEHSMLALLLASVLSLTVYFIVLVSWFHPRFGPGTLPPAILTRRASETETYIVRGDGDMPGPSSVSAGSAAGHRSSANPFFRKDIKVAQLAKTDHVNVGTTNASDLEAVDTPSAHPVVAGMLWFVTGPHLDMTQREASAPNNHLQDVQNRVKHLPAWALDWDVYNREWPSGPFHSKYGISVLAERNGPSLPSVLVLPPPIDVSLRAFAGIALLIFLQLSARLGDMRFVAAVGEAGILDSLLHASSVLPFSAFDWGCLMSTYLDGWRGLVFGGAQLLLVCLLAPFVGCIAWLGLQKCSHQQHEAADDGTDQYLQSWRAAVRPVKPTPVVIVTAAATGLLAFLCIPAAVSMAASAAFAVAPNAHGSLSLLSDFTTTAFGPQHREMVAVGAILVSLALLVPVVGVLRCRTICRRELQLQAATALRPAKGHVMLQKPLGTAAGDTVTVYQRLYWPVGGLLWGWLRPSMWWWNLMLFGFANGLALLPGLVTNAWGRLFIATTCATALWLSFEWCRPYATHAQVGAPTAVFGASAVQLALPLHVLQHPSAPAAEGVSREVLASGQRAGRALLRVEGVLRTRLMRVLFACFWLQCLASMLEYVWSVSLFAGTEGTRDTAIAAGTPSADLDANLFGSSSVSVLLAAKDAMSLIRGMTLLLGVVACTVAMLPRIPRSFVHTVLNSGQMCTTQSCRIALRLCDRSRPDSGRLCSASGAVRDNRRKYPVPATKRSSGLAPAVASATGSRKHAAPQPLEGSPLHHNPLWALSHDLTSDADVKSVGPISTHEDAVVDDAPRMRSASSFEGANPMGAAGARPATSLCVMARAARHRASSDQSLEAGYAHPRHHSSFGSDTALGWSDSDGTPLTGQPQVAPLADASPLKGASSPVKGTFIRGRAKGINPMLVRRHQTGAQGQAAPAGLPSLLPQPSGPGSSGSGRAQLEGGFAGLSGRTKRMVRPSIAGGALMHGKTSIVRARPTSVLQLADSSRRLVNRLSAGRSAVPSHTHLVHRLEGIAGLHQQALAAGGASRRMLRSSSGDVSPVHRGAPGHATADAKPPTGRAAGGGRASPNEKGSARRPKRSGARAVARII